MGFVRVNLPPLKVAVLAIEAELREKLISLPLSLRPRLNGSITRSHIGFEIAPVSRQEHERVQLGCRGDRDIGKAGSAPLRNRPVRKRAGDARSLEVERKNAVAVEVLDRVPPGCEPLGLARRPSRADLAMPARISAAVTTER